MSLTPQTHPQKQDITRALLHLISQGGFEAVSIRHVAETAGCSVGRVQRQFSTKEALIHEAIQHAALLTNARLQDRLNGLPEQTSQRERVTTYLTELLDTTPENRPQAIIWLNIQTRATTDAALREQMNAYARQSLEALARFIEEGQRHAEFSAHTAPLQAALTLLTLVDGLMLNLLTDNINAEQANEILRATLHAQLLP